MELTNYETGEVNEIITKDDEGNLQVAKEIIEAIRVNDERRKEVQAQDKKFKEQLKKAMEEYGIEKISSDDLTVSYVAEHEQWRLDSKKIKEDYSRIYEECSKCSTVSASVRVTLK